MSVTATKKYFKNKITPPPPQMTIKIQTPPPPQNPKPKILKWFIKIFRTYSEYRILERTMYIMYLPAAIYLLTERAKTGLQCHSVQTDIGHFDHNSTPFFSDLGPAVISI